MATIGLGIREFLFRLSFPFRGNLESLQEMRAKNMARGRQQEQRIFFAKECCAFTQEKFRFKEKEKQSLTSEQVTHCSNEKDALFTLEMTSRVQTALNMV